MADPFDLQRFVDAQDRGGSYAAAEAELRSGRKRSHWMWFVFPQVRGLGHSAMAERYGIGSREEAVAYLAHDVLGPRLHRCATLVARSDAETAQALMGGIDALKLGSSMTLFATVASEATGEETVASEATGEEAVASEATGEEAVASEATGEETVASEATGDHSNGADFVAVLDRYFGGERDAQTLRLLGSR